MRLQTSAKPLDLKINRNKNDALAEPAGRMTKLVRLPYCKGSAVQVQLA